MNTIYSTFLLNAHHLLQLSDLDMVDFAAHITIHAIKIVFKILIFTWKVLSLKAFIHQQLAKVNIVSTITI